MSNFPVGMFDALLPRWPTLGITLEEFPPDANPNDPADGAVMPNNNLLLIGSTWARFGDKRRPSNLPGFLGAVINAMQNWQDTMQSEAPGFRDRIAHVRLSKREGGLNLTMPAGIIRNLLDRGERAGALLVDPFCLPAATGIVTTWENHRRVRLRTTLDVAERYATGFRRAWAAPAAPGSTTYPDVLSGMLKSAGGTGYPYSSQAQLGEAARVAGLLAGLAGTEPPSQVSVQNGAPRPRSDLRARPRY